MRHAVYAIVIVLLAGCGTARRAPSPETPAPSATPAQPRPAAPGKQAFKPLPPRVYPECDPRAGDPDRVRVALGLLAGDCAVDGARNGVFVTRLVPVAGMPGPAQSGGIRVGDRILGVDACTIETTHGLAMQLRRGTPGWVARIIVERDGRRQETFVETRELLSKAEPAGAPHLSTAGCRAIGRGPAK